MEKSFFRERSIREIQQLHVKRVYTQRGLVERIYNLEFSEDALEIRTIITPHRFFFNHKTKKYNLKGEQASRKCIKHGNRIILDHPKTRRECFDCPDTPLQIIERAFYKLRGIREEEINYISYSYRPDWGDRTIRSFPFIFIDQGVRLFGYAENIAHDSDIDSEGIESQCFDNANKVKKQGASIVVEVPSKTKKHLRYKFVLSHVPIIRNQDNLATILMLKPAVLRDEETQELIEGRTPHANYNDIRYPFEDDPESGEIITFYPQDVAAYLAIMKDQWKNHHNRVPAEMNPFALPSRRSAEFCKKLGNNIIIYDPTLKNKDKLRKPHLDEKSILLARGIGKFGYDEFTWDPERDGKLKDYNWSI